MNEQRYYVNVVNVQQTASSVYGGGVHWLMASWLTVSWLMVSWLTVSWLSVASCGAVCS